MKRLVFFGGLFFSTLFIAPSSYGLPEAEPDWKGPIPVQTVEVEKPKDPIRGPIPLPPDWKPLDRGKCPKGEGPIQQDFLQCVATILTAPLQCASLCSAPGSEPSKKSFAQVCTEPLVNRHAPGALPGRHAYMCVKVPPPSEPQDECRLPEAYSCETGKEYCLDDYGTGICSISDFQRCERNGPRANEECQDLWIPKTQNEHKSSQQLCCMMKVLTGFEADYSFVGGNCGSIPMMFTDCLGGYIFNPSKLNLGVGCDWREREFWPRGHSDIKMTGDAICKTIFKVCGCITES